MGVFILFKNRDALARGGGERRQLGVERPGEARGRHGARPPSMTIPRAELRMTANRWLGLAVADLLFATSALAEAPSPGGALDHH